MLTEWNSVQHICPHKHVSLRQSLSMYDVQRFFHAKTALDAKRMYQYKGSLNKHLLKSIYAYYVSNLMLNVCAYHVHVCVWWGAVIGTCVYVGLL